MTSLTGNKVIILVVWRRVKWRSIWRLYGQSYLMISVPKEQCKQPKRCNNFFFINLFKSALRVSNDRFAHPQEHFLTVYTAFGTMHRHCCRPLPRLRWNLPIYLCVCLFVYLFMVWRGNACRVLMGKPKESDNFEDQSIDGRILSGYRINAITF